MGFGNFLRGIAAQINPFDGGKTYGSYNPPKKKLQPGDPGYVAPASPPSAQAFNQSQQSQQSDQPQIKTQTPQNIFAGLNNNLRLPGAPNNNVPVVQNSDITSILKPQPGEVVTPTAPKPAIPFWKRALNDVGNVGSAAAGTSLAAVRAVEGLTGGIPEVANQITHGVNYIPRKIAGDNSSVDRALSKANRDSDSLAHTLNKPTDWLAKKTDEAALGYGPGSRAIYKPAQVAINVPLAAAGAAEGASTLASKLSGVEDLSKSEGVLGALDRFKNFVDLQRVSPTLAKLDESLGGTLSKSKWLSKFMPEIEDVNRVTAPSEIPVRQGVSVDQPVSEPVNIPVRNANQPKSLIQEVGGDAKTATTNAEAAAKAINVRRVEAAKNVDTVVNPDRTIEGVTPFRPSPATTTSAEVQAERDALDQALSNKEITKTAHTEANKALDNTPVAGEVSTGRPIAVKGVTGIDVADQTVVPQNLPETPGTVRAIAQTSPMTTRTEAATSAPVVTAPVELPKEQAASNLNQIQNVLPPVQSGEGLVPTSVSPARQELINSLKEANQQSVKDARALSVARGERAAKASGMADGLEGEAATQARRSGFKGELGHRGTYVGVGGDNADKIFNDLRIEAQRHPELSKRVYTLDNVEESLSRAIRGKDLSGNVVGAPTKGQVELLRKYFGGDIADAVDEAVNISKSTKDKILEGAGQVIGAPRSIMASMDLSATVRQGGVLGTRFPKEAAKAAVEQLKYFGSSEAFKKGMEEIANRPSYESMIKSGLDVTGTRGVDKAEEQFVSTLAEKIPGFGRGVAASDRAYTGFLTKLRADVFDNITSKYAERGIELSQKETNDLAKFINTASGRGDLGKLEDHAKTLSTTLFSPRLWKSRLDMLNPVYYAKLSGPARKYALQSAGTFASTAGTVLGLASLAGANVETDLRSSDFGKIKVGNTRYDILGGFQQNLVFAWRELTGEKKSSISSEVTKFARSVPNYLQGKSDKEAGVQMGPYTPNRVSIASDLVGNKATPLLGAAARIISGKDKGGNPVNPLEELARMSVPLGLSGTVDAANNVGSATNPKDLLKGALINSPDTVGISAQTYGSTPTKGSSSQPGKKVSASQTKADASTEVTDLKSSAGEGYSLQQTSDGKYAYSLNGEVKTTPNLKDAQQAIAKDSFTHSDGNSKIVKDKYYYKDENGDTKVMPKYKHEFDVADSQNQLDMYVAKDNEDYGAWADTANKQLKVLTTLRDKYNQDSQADKVDDVQKKIETLKHDMKKYAGYGGGFTKPKQGKQGNRGKQLDTSFGTLKAGLFTPQVQQYDTISAKSGGIPHIAVKRPNIVHTIGRG